jgi:hypothetical protein
MADFLKALILVGPENGSTGVLPALHASEIAAQMSIVVLVSDVNYCFYY